MIGALISPECGLPTVTSQSQPATTGSVTTWLRLAPNTSVAVTAAIAAAMPAMAERTGIAVRPRPGPNASRAPDTAVTGKFQRAIHHAARASRPVAAGATRAARVRITCHAVSAAWPISSAASVAAPPSTMGGSNDRPGETSAWRAKPMGVKTESAKAIGMASSRPATATTAPGARAIAKSCRPDVPSARSAGKSSAEV